ncbi:MULTISPECIES: flagellar biosynthesis repressor FlbT [unclassified Methylobacterium]|uniref:flagellar biosynthesis repressor FlbT n=1 Tax=unclassified Methylobacterium TaxID=2615210 RepID=UPI00226ABD31|nr:MULTISPECIES: flagellar biosynthesis repressor FlbT [unclassified Methylobacterium]
MPLRIALKPLERLIINGASILNSDRPSAFLVETQCKLLRGSDIISQDDLDTDCKKLCFLLQDIYLIDNPQDKIQMFYEFARRIMMSDIETVPYLLKIQNEVQSGQFYKAIKYGQELLAYEQGCLDRDFLRRSVK